MHQSIPGVLFRPPFDSEPSDAILTLVSRRAPQRDARALKSVDPIRPSLVLQRRRVARGTSLEAVAALCVQDVSNVVGSYRVVSTKPLSFADGKDGLLLVYKVRATPYLLIQTQALRVDGDVATTLTITSSASISAEQRETFLESLRSMRVDAEQGGNS